MTMRNVPAVICKTIIAVFMFHAVSASADMASCFVPCYAQEKECLEREKNSPNEIDRELCGTRKNECLAKCNDIQRIEDEQRKRDEAAKEQEEKARWESDGVSPEEQARLKQEREEAEAEARADERERIERERLEKQSGPKEEDKEKQDLKGDDSLNGIKIYQFK